MDNITLVEKDVKDKLLPIYLYKHESMQRDNVICFVFYRGTRYNHTNMEDAIKDFDTKRNNRTISRFGGR